MTVRGHRETKLTLVALAGQFAALVTVWDVSGLACQNEDILFNPRERMQQVNDQGARANGLL